jgi:hypothetical protein
MDTILNTWRSTAEKPVYYFLGFPIYTNGHWSIYCEFAGSFIYTYKNIAISNLGGINKDLVDILSNGVINVDGDAETQLRVLINRCLETKRRGEELLKALKGN